MKWLNVVAIESHSFLCGAYRTFNVDPFPLSLSLNAEELPTDESKPSEVAMFKVALNQLKWTSYLLNLFHNTCFLFREPYFNHKVHISFFILKCILYNTLNALYTKFKNCLPL